MSDSTQAANVTAADDFEANRAKTKKALPALLIVFTLGTLMIQAFNLVFQNIGDSLGMSASASLISTLPGIVLGVVCMLYGTLCDFISPKRMTLFGVSALVIGSLLGFFGSFNFWVVLIARMIQVAGAQVAGSVFLVMTVKYLDDKEKAVYIGLQCRLLFGRCNRRVCRWFHHFLRLEVFVPRSGHFRVLHSTVDQEHSGYQRQGRAHRRFRHCAVRGVRGTHRRLLLVPERVAAGSHCAARHRLCRLDP